MTQVSRTEVFACQESSLKVTGDKEIPFEMPMEETNAHS